MTNLKMRVAPKLSNTTSGTRTQTPFKELELKSSVSANFTKVAKKMSGTGFEPMLPP